jgi:hypothetical protein
MLLSDAPAIRCEAWKPSSVEWDVAGRIWSIRGRGRRSRPSRLFHMLVLLTLSMRGHCEMVIGQYLPGSRLVFLYPFHHRQAFDVTQVQVVA